MIKRFLQDEFDYLLGNFPAVGVIGARQVGKTTMVKNHLGNTSRYTYLDLERNSDRAKLSDAELFLQANAEKTVILDEVQVMPELFPLLRSLIDEDRRPARFVVLGSASPELLRQSSESLAGRIVYLHLQPFSLPEVKGRASWKELWVLGGFPEPLLKGNSRFASRWQQNFIDNYLQRDLPLLGLTANPSVSLRLFRMLASANASFLNYSQLARSLGLSVPTVKTYFGFFENAFLVHSLQPWAVNLKKRIVKSPKVYFSDTGMLHHLLGVADFNGLMGNIAAGASWETFVINQVRSLLLPSDECYFYRTQDGAETDLLVRRNNQWLFGAEIKLTNAPSLTKGSYIAMEDLGLPRLYVITPESENYPIGEKVEVINISDFLGKIIADFKT